MNTFLKVVKRIMPIIFMFFVVFETQRAFTDFPEIHINVLNGNVSPSMEKSLDIYVYMGDWSTFAYFTTLSNILFAVTFFLSWTIGIKINPYWKLAVNIYMIVTCIIFWTILAPFFVWGKDRYFDFIYIHEHLLVTMMSLGWYHFEKEKLQLKKSFLVTISFPVLYLLFSVIIQIVSKGGAAVYPFLNFKDVLSAGLPIGASIVVALLLIAVIGGAMMLIDYLYVKPEIFMKLNRIFKK